jgi:hypothetical protein
MRTGPSELTPRTAERTTRSRSRARLAAAASPLEGLAPDILHLVASFLPDAALGALASTTKTQSALHGPTLRARFEAREARRQRLFAAMRTDAASLDRATMCNQQGKLDDGLVLTLAELIGAGAAPQLEEVRLSCNAMGDAACAALVDALPRCAALRVLNLRFNRIGVEGVAAIARALRAGRLGALQRLFLDGNPGASVAALALGAGDALGLFLRLGASVGGGRPEVLGLGP